MLLTFGLSPGSAESGKATDVPLASVQEQFNRAVKFEQSSRWAEAITMATDIKAPTKSHRRLYRN